MGESDNAKEREDLVVELKLMKTLLVEPHPNVVRLLGCCTAASDKEPTYLIMEYVAKGKLQEFLRRSRAEHYYGNLHGSSQKLTSRDLTSFCYQVSNKCYNATYGSREKIFGAVRIILTPQVARG